jgi:peptidoglycan/xylan/chitin deacetylase (PgdA/CDA1 family)
MKSPLPILMYHGIKTDSKSVPEGREIGAEFYDVLLENFASQMNWLNEYQYQAIAIEEIDRYSQQKQVILTFDDGEINNFIHALPILKRLKLKAYFFVIVDRIGKPGYMGWDELRQMQEAGTIIGSHSMTHPILTDLTDDRVEYELYNSLKILVNHLGDRVNTLSIPRGFCNDKVMQIAYASGYRHVFISERPANLESDCWERTAVKSSWNIQRFEKAINGIKPVDEQVLAVVKGIIKKPFNGETYNRLRNAIISISN